MLKQEVINGLIKLLGEAKEAEEYSPHQGMFGEDVEVLEKAIDLIKKCVPILKCKGAAHEDPIELVYPKGSEDYIRKCIDQEGEE